jgi:hypothetical protein
VYDGLLLSFRAAAANATTTPTFAPNGLTARTITKRGGTALAVGDIAGNLAEYWVRYNSANTRWELLNPTGVGAIAELTTATIDTAADYIAFIDATDNAPKKCLASAVSGPMVLLSAQTISNAASLDFTGFLTSTYRAYKIFLYDVYGASAAALWCRYGAAASYISTSTYNSALIGRDNAGNPETADNSGGTKIIMSGASLQATSTQGGVWEITIYRPSHSNETRMTWNGSYKSDGLSRYNTHTGSGMNTGTSAVTDIQFLMASGNIYCVGLLYGIA